MSVPNAIPSAKRTITDGHEVTVKVIVGDEES